MNELISPRKDIAVGEKMKTLLLDTSSLPIAARPGGASSFLCKRPR